MFCFGLVIGINLGGFLNIENIQFQTMEDILIKTLCSPSSLNSQRPSWNGMERLNCSKKQYLEIYFPALLHPSLRKVSRDTQDRAMTKGSVVPWVYRAFLLQLRGHICCDGLQLTIKAGRDYTAAPCWWADADIFFHTSSSLIFPWWKDVCLDITLQEAAPVCKDVKVISWVN